MRLSQRVEECTAMRPNARAPELEYPDGAELPVMPGDLDKLARWVPQKEKALLDEICERARHDRDLARPALLLCLAYAEKTARMLDQDPFPTVTEKIKERLQALREKDGL